MDRVLLVKIITLVVYPVGLIALFLFFGLLMRMFGRKILARFFVIMSLLIFLASTNPMLAKKLAGDLEQRFPQQALEQIPKADAIVVLGGGLRLPSPPLKHPQLKEAADRYWYATQLYQAGKADIIILTGGNVYTRSSLQGESHYAAQILKQWGVPRHALITEQSSRTTAQNAKNSEAFFKIHDIDSIILVTSAIHMDRAYHHFSEMSIKVIPASADVRVTHVKKPWFMDWLPSADAMELTTISMHEYYGQWANWLAGQIAILKEPTA